MPRKSQAELDTPKPQGIRVVRLLQPGEYLPQPAADIFAEVVASVGEGHFQIVDRPMLEQYAVALSVARDLAAVIERDGVMTDDGHVSQTVRVLKQQQALIGQLASRLRLTTQARISKDKATTTARAGQQSAADLYEAAK